MDIGRSITDQFDLNVLCSKIGDTPQELYDKVVNLLTRGCHKILLPNILPQEFKALAKEKVPFKDWFMGWINCKYHESPPAVDWAECQIFYKCHAAMIIVDMSNCDSQQYGHQLTKLKRTLTSENIQCYTILVWNPVKTHFKYFENEKDIDIVPENITDENLSDFLYKRIQGLVVKTAMYFLRLIEKLSSDSHTIPLFNAKEEVPKDSSKVKKKKQGRALKICGDLALILGCWNDAEAYYNRAHKQLDTNDDFVWLGKTKEGLMACLYLQYKFGEAEQDTPDKIMKRLALNSKEKLEPASVLYKKVKTTQGLESDIELYFKRLRLFKELKSTADFHELFKLYPEVARLGLKGESIYRGMLLIASFYYDMEMYKKAGLYLKLLADSIVADQYDMTLARDIYLACFPLYSMPLPANTLPETYPKREFLKVITDNQDLSKTIVRTVPKVQIQLIRDVMKLSLHDKPLEARMLAIIMHYFMKDLDEQTQKFLYSKFILLGNSLNGNLSLDLSLIPKILQLTPVAETVRLSVKYLDRTPKAGDIFIFNPWKGHGAGKAEEYNWMEGNDCFVKVQLCNKFRFKIHVDKLVLVTEGPKTVHYPISLTLKEKQGVQDIPLKFKVLEAGKLNILGVFVKVSNFVYFHPINNKGAVMATEVAERTAKEKVGIREIPIAKRINTLKMKFEDRDEVVEISRKSPFKLRILVENKNDCVMIVHKLLWTFVFSDTTVLDKEVEPDRPELSGFEKYSVILHRSILEKETLVKELIKDEHQMILNFDMNTVPNADSLSKVYLKLVYYEKEKPDIHIEDSISKHILMKKGLSVRDFEVHDSFSLPEIEMNERIYHHINVDEYLFIVLQVSKNDGLNDENEYSISFQRKDLPAGEILCSGILSSTRQNTKLAIKLHRDVALKWAQDPSIIKELIYGHWRERDHLGSGYMFLDNIDVTPLIVKLNHYNLSINMNINLKVNAEEGRYMVTRGERCKIDIKMSLLDGNNKKLHCFVLISDDSGYDFKGSGVMDSSKTVIYKGKKTFILDLTKESSTDSGSIEVMFMENRDYKVFCFAVDEDNLTVYSFKHHYYISVVS